MQTSSEHCRRSPCTASQKQLNDTMQRTLSGLTSLAALLVKVSDPGAAFSPSSAALHLSSGRLNFMPPQQAGARRSVLGKAASAVRMSDKSDKARATDPRDAVVKIYNSRQRPSWTVPWQLNSLDTGTGSGAVVSYMGKLFILTAAHVVSDTRYLQIQRTMDSFNGEKFRARVASICHDADLALLTVDSSEALASIEPLQLASNESLPEVFDKVRVVGYPVGGDAVSVTEGVVSRVEVREYTHSHRPGLALTVDAAINSGNSGGPVLDAATSSIIGVAFQKIVSTGVELQGHAVPGPLIHKFFQETSARGDHDMSTGPLSLKMPSLGCAFQTLESPVMRRSLGLSEDLHGVMVSRVQYSDSDEKPALQVGDVLLSFDGIDIDDLGFCNLMGRRLSFSAVRDLRPIGLEVPLKVFRNKTEIMVKHTLKPTQYFVPRAQYDMIPRYFAVGGLVFQPLNDAFLSLFNDRPPAHLQVLSSGGEISPDRTEAVLLSQVLVDKANEGSGTGYVGSPLVNNVNGVPIRNLGHLVELVRAARQEYEKTGHDGFLKIDLGTGDTPFLLVLQLSELNDADKRVHQRYGLPKEGCSHHFLK